MLNSLSARLLVLTVLFVMLAEIVVMVSSMSRFRQDWMEDRLCDAQIASLAMSAAAGGHIDPALVRELLANAGVDGIILKRPDGRLLTMGRDPGPAAASYDLRAASDLRLVIDSWRTLLSGGQGAVRVTGAARNGGGEYIAVVLDEKPLHAALVDHARHLLIASMLLSLFTAVLIYVALFRLFVRPMKDLSDSIERFSAAPHDARRMVPASSRRDEIGTLQRALRSMEDHVRYSLAQKTGLASLGEAVAKVNHDLRNILATARLVSNRLSTNDDPGVRTISVTLMRAIDRAIEICSDTLKFGRPQDLNPRVIAFDLRPLADEVGHAVGLSDETNPMFLNHVSAHLSVEADPDHLFRALQNLIRNAAEAIGDGFGEITIRAYDMGTETIIEVADTGPGLPDHARENLFKPFRGTTHEHGAGLGLVNVLEIMQAHGGEVRLLKSDVAGATFQLHLPRSQNVPLRHAVG